MNRRTTAALAVLLVTLASDPARGDDRSAAADALFREGRELHDAGRYASACPKFAESYRLDPATGSLLALASCLEAEGKLASAWTRYNELADRASREGKTERAETARARLAVLDGKLARLKVVVGPEARVPGLVVERDEVALGEGAWGTELPVDRGAHVVVARAPGYETVTLRTSCADGQRCSVTVPRLAQTARSASASAPAEAPPPAGPPLRTIGVVAMVVGGVSAIGGTVFGVKALDGLADSNANGRCVEDACDPDGKRLRLDARSAGNASTALFLASAALVGAGITLFVLSSPPTDGGRGRQTRLQWRGSGLALQGEF